MTQEEKQLLLKDICARLPYETQVYIEVLDDNHSMIDGGSSDDELDTVWIGVLQSGNPYHIIKPYLRPMSSMTEEEEEEYWNIINLKSPEMPVGEIPSIETIAQCSIIILDWLLSKGFDIRGLIPMGLALEAPDGMYKAE